MTRVLTATTVIVLAVAATSITASGLSWRGLRFLRTLEVSKVIEEIFKRISSELAPLGHAFQEAVIWVCFHNFIAILTEVYLLLTSIYICI